LTVGQLAQLSRCPTSWAANATVSVVVAIVRIAYPALLAVGLLAHRTELVLGLLVVGQFGRAIQEALSPRRG
jgi:hypothetical protein